MWRIKSRAPFVPVEVFWLDDGAVFRYCKYINVKEGNWKCRAMERRSLSVLSITFLVCVSGGVAV